MLLISLFSLYPCSQIHSKIKTSTLSQNRDVHSGTQIVLDGLALSRDFTAPPQAVGPKGFGELERVQEHSSGNGWGREAATASRMAGRPANRV